MFLCQVINITRDWTIVVHNAVVVLKVVTFDLGRPAKKVSDGVSEGRQEKSKGCKVWHSGLLYSTQTKNGIATLGQILSTASMNPMEANVILESTFPKV